MKYTLRYADKAKSDLNDIFNYIAADNPERAITFVAEIENSILNLIDFPFLGPEERVFDMLLPNSRKLIYKDYIAHYTVYEKEKQVVVTRVLHGSRQNYTLS